MKTGAASAETKADDHEVLNPVHLVAHPCDAAASLSFFVGVDDLGQHLTKAPEPH